MNSLFPDAIRDGRPRQCILSVLLLSLLFALTGFFAMPASGTRQANQVERFPCENCPCGCLSAEYCWDMCCCHSDQEKLQWAARNSVNPPEFLVKRVAANSGEHATLPVKPTCCCGAKNSAKSCDLAVTRKPGANDSASVQRTTTILMWKAAECRGLNYFWTVLATAYVASDSVLTIDLPFVGWSTPASERVHPRAECPDTPVP